MFIEISDNDIVRIISGSTEILDQIINAAVENIPASDVAAEMDTAAVANEFDYDSLADHIQYSDLAGEIDYSDLADCIDHDDLVECMSKDLYVQQLFHRPVFEAFKEMAFANNMLDRIQAAEVQLELTQVSLMKLMSKRQLKKFKKQLSKEEVE